MPLTNLHISFDWALKIFLRQKTYFEILEGFLSELLRRDIFVSKILEFEVDKESADQKSNLVDILRKKVMSELFLVELLYHFEFDYFHRMLFNPRKLITDNFKMGNKFQNIKKKMINFIYSDLEQGEDYVYHFTTHFRGIHQGEILQISKL